ncbi:MAG TPA: ABC transporter permease [Ignavibacteria bacterium]
MFNRILTIAVKEIRQIKRDPLTLLVIFIFPILMIILFGYALNFDVKEIVIGVYDQDRSELSREFAVSIDRTEYFQVVKYYENQQQVNKALDSKDVQCVMVIPPKLSEDFYAKKNVKIQYLVDGVNGNTATVITSYVGAATRNLSNKYINEVLEKKGIELYQPVIINQSFWFNPELKTTQFLILGLMGSILITLAVVLTAVAIVRERELGTIEQINVSPLTSIELLLGKIIPYIILSLIVWGIILLFGYLLFDVTVKGSWILLFVSTVFYLFASLSLGIFVSTISDSQQVAFQIGTLISQLPSNLLSGFMFPIESMPPAVQILTNITPTKYYLIALRAVIIRGVGVEAFWEQLVYLFIFAIVCLTIATLKIIKQRK